MQPTEVWVRLGQASAAEVGLCPAATEEQGAAEAGGEQGSQRGASLLRSLHTGGWDGVTQKAAKQSSSQKPVAPQARKLPASVSRLLSFSITL